MLFTVDPLLATAIVVELAALLCCLFFSSVKAKGAVTTWLVRSSPDQAVRVRALARDIVLRS